MKKRKLWKTAGVLAIFLIAASLIYTKFISEKNSNQTVTIGTIGTDTQVWKHIAASSAAQNAHLDIKVKDFTDRVTCDRALSEGTIDANAFQSYAFLVNYNNSNKKNPIAAIRTTYIEPMGIYSKKYKKINSIPDNAKIVLINEPAAESRGLKLLESAKLITLKEHSSSELLTTKDIIKNPKKLKFAPETLAQVPKTLEDETVAAATIDNTTAQQSELNVFKDSIYHENLNKNTRGNVNLVAVAKKNLDSEKLKRLANLYHDKKIQEHIKKEFPAKLEVNKSVNYLND